MIRVGRRHRVHAVALSPAERSRIVMLASLYYAALLDFLSRPAVFGARRSLQTPPSEGKQGVRPSSSPARASNDQRHAAPLTVDACALAASKIDAAARRPRASGLDVSRRRHAKLASARRSLHPPTSSKLTLPRGRARADSAQATSPPRRCSSLRSPRRSSPALKVDASCTPPLSAREFPHRCRSCRCSWSDRSSPGCTAATVLRGHLLERLVILAAALAASIARTAARALERASASALPSATGAAPKWIGMAHRPDRSERAARRRQRYASEASYASTLRAARRLAKAPPHPVESRRFAALPQRP